jgi:hypothetical protein
MKELKATVTTRDHVEPAATAVAPAETGSAK